MSWAGTLACWPVLALLAAAIAASEGARLDVDAGKVVQQVGEDTQLLPSVSSWWCCATPHLSCCAVAHHS
jgi:hypothetical protein